MVCVFSFGDVTLQRSVLGILSHGNVREDDSALYHGLRFYLSHSTPIHTHDNWYLARVNIGDFTRTREVVLTHTYY